MPRKESVAAIVERALRRARVLAAAESAAAGAVVAAWSVLAGFVTAVVVAAWHARRVSRPAILAILERADPRSRNLIVTADELASGTLVAKPAIRERIEADADAVVSSVNLGRLFPIARAASLVALAVAAWSVAFLIDSRFRSTPVSGRAGRSSAPIAAAQAGAMRVTITITPPAYTHLAKTTLTDPVQLDLVEHSTVQWSIAASASQASVEINGDVKHLSPTTAGTFETTTVAGRSGYALLTAADGARRMIPVSVKPDALPTVRVAVPGRDLVFGDGNPRVTFTAQATDDYGLRALTLRYTKVSGSGEQFEFVDGEIPLAVTPTSEREWKGSAARSIAELGLVEGDMLVYRAVASDARPGEGEGSSDAFVIEISKVGVAAGDAFTLPEQETKYALSQQMLIVKTDRLHQRRGAMDAAAFAEAAQNLAVEQRMIRTEFVFMLGGEIEDEEVEAEQSVEIQAGRLVNRGQRDIRNATVAMSQAEKLLTGADTGSALKAERAAVEALQRAFSRERYLLRALASRSQLDLTRRLTGSIGQSLGWRRQLLAVPANRRAAQLQSLVDGIGQATSSAQVEMLAEMAIRIDAESAALRQIAADLQQLADRWSALNAADRSSALDAIARAASAEARSTLADPPIVIGGGR